MRHVGAFAIGDIYGSYITQLTVILGVVILIIPKNVNRTFSPHIVRDGGLVLISLIILSVQLSDGYISRWEAIFSISLYLGYVIYLYKSSLKDKDTKVEQLSTIVAMEQNLGIHSINPTLVQVPLASEMLSSLNFNSSALPVIEKPRKSPVQIVKYISLVLIGTLLTYFGADLVVTSGVDIAISLNVSEHIIAATIVGAGTAIPEFTVSVNAARRQKPDIAFGNLLGSNIVDPLFSVAIGVLIQPIYLSEMAIHHILYDTLPCRTLVLQFQTQFPG